MRLVLAAAGMLAAGSLAAQDLPELQARGTLKVTASRDEQPEMFTFEPGPNPGFEREMVEGFARLHKLKLEVVVAPSFAERIPMVVDGRADLSIGLIVTPERKQKVDFTSEVLPARHVVVTRKPAAAIDDVEALRAASVGVLKGTTWAKAAYEAGVPKDAAREYPTLESLLQALQSGEIGATTMSVSDFTLAAKRDPALQPGAIVGPSGSAAWAIRKDADRLEAALNEYLVNFRRGPSWSRLIVKYFGEQALSVLGREK